jgi:SPASM domain peptide maturase of grasp-with-spasm system
MSDVYMQYSNCISVKGFNRAAMYDLQRNRYIFLPNFFVDILLLENNIISLKSKDIDAAEYLDFLVGDCWGLYTTKQNAELFPKLSLEWDSFSVITNTQIDLNNTADEIAAFFNKVLPQFEKLYCKDYQINFFQNISHVELSNFLSKFNDTNVNSLSITMPYASFSAFEIEDLYNLQPRLNFIYFCDSPQTIPDVSSNIINKVCFAKDTVKNSRNNQIHYDYFTTNIILFSESQKHNTYYNRKLCIDSAGNIKNSPEHDNNFGNIRDTTLSEAINKKGFKDLWLVHKEIIDVCKECEFRHMCIDSCIPKRRTDGTFFRSTECNYNPYIAKWKGEEGYLSLSECGVTVNEIEIKIENEKLEAINFEIWGEG